LHHSCRSALARECVMSVSASVPDGTPSRASCGHESALAAITPVGARLPANALCQSAHQCLTKCLRGQARSCNAGQSGADVLTGMTPSPASRLLQSGHTFQSLIVPTLRVGMQTLTLRVTSPRKTLDMNHYWLCCSVGYAPALAAITPVGARLPGNALCQSAHQCLTKCVRGQARSYSAGQSGADILTGMTPSPASRLLQSGYTIQFTDRSHAPRGKADSYAPRHTTTQKLRQ
jgi:hypothetical protein